MAAARCRPARCTGEEPGRKIRTDRENLLEHSVSQSCLWLGDEVKIEGGGQWYCESCERWRIDAVN